MKPSQHQQKVIEFLQSPDPHHLVVNAVAGSGKSTLLKLAAEAIAKQGLNISRDCMVLVFNKKNAETLLGKLGPLWKGSIGTVHSAGYRELRHFLNGQKLIVETTKYRKIAKNLDWFNGSLPQEEKPVSLTAFLKLADFVRQTMCPLQADDLAKTVDHYSLDVPLKHLAEIVPRLELLFQHGSNLASTHLIIDHTDMLWLPLSWKIGQITQKRRLLRLFVDEAQDMSALQLEFVLSLLDERGKSLFVGDPAQSINGFCGADTDSFANIKTRLNAREFILPTCYRCPTSHIELINKLYPAIPIEPNIGAIRGKIRSIRERDLWREGDARVKAGDLIISRKTASLVELHLLLISQNVPAHLVGSSLKQQLLDLVEELGEMTDERSSFEARATVYLEQKQELYRERNNSQLLELTLKDNLKALKAIVKHWQCQGLDDLVDSIESLFDSESSNCVNLSTVHRAKGLEAQRVYIADPMSLPLMWDKMKNWQMQQENNLLYVALSRSTSELFLIGETFWFDQRNEIEEIIDSSTPKELTPVVTPSPNIVTSIDIEKAIENADDRELQRLLTLIHQERANRITTSFQETFGR